MRAVPGDDLHGAARHVEQQVAERRIQVAQPFRNQPVGQRNGRVDLGGITVNRLGLAVFQITQILPAERSEAKRREIGQQRRLDRIAGGAHDHFLILEREPIHGSGTVGGRQDLRDESADGWVDHASCDPCTNFMHGQYSTVTAADPKRTEIPLQLRVLRASVVIAHLGHRVFSSLSHRSLYAILPPA